MLFSASQNHGSRGARADWIYASHLWLAQISTYVTVIIFHDNSPLSYWNPVPKHDSYQTICTLAIHDAIASDHRNYRYTIASGHQTTDTR